MISFKTGGLNNDYCQPVTTTAHSGIYRCPKEKMAILAIYIARRQRFCCKQTTYIFPTRRHVQVHERNLLYSTLIGLILSPCLAWVVRTLSALKCGFPSAERERVSPLLGACSLIVNNGDRPTLNKPISNSVVKSQQCYQQAKGSSFFNIKRYNAYVILEISEKHYVLVILTTVPLY